MTSWNFCGNSAEAFVGLCGGGRGPCGGPVETLRGLRTGFGEIFCTFCGDFVETLGDSGDFARICETLGISKLRGSFL